MQKTLEITPFPRQSHVTYHTGHPASLLQPLGAWLAGTHGSLEDQAHTVCLAQGAVGRLPVPFLKTHGIVTAVVLSFVPRLNVGCHRAVETRGSPYPYTNFKISPTVITL